MSDPDTTLTPPLSKEERAAATFKAVNSIANINSGFFADPKDGAYYRSVAELTLRYEATVRELESRSLSPSLRELAAAKQRLERIATGPWYFEYEYGGAWVGWYDGIHAANGQDTLEDCIDAALERVWGTQKEALQRGGTMMPEFQKLLDRKRAHARAIRESRVSSLPPADGTIERDHPEGTCQRCGGPNVCWFAPSPLWNIATIDQPADRYTIWCPTCFVSVAIAKGLGTVWRVSPDGYAPVPCGCSRYTNVHDQEAQCLAVSSLPPTDATEPQS